VTSIGVLMKNIIPENEWQERLQEAWKWLQPRKPKEPRVIYPKRPKKLKVIRLKKPKEPKVIYPKRQKEPKPPKLPKVKVVREKPVKVKAVKEKPVKRETRSEYLARNPWIPQRSREIRKEREVAAGGKRVNWFEWSKILKKYGAKCLRCKVEGVTLTQDHVLPISMGGKTVPENIQPLCRSCNSWKSDRHIDYRPF
jgi:5-methylcytosine-specific restriction endonuclease McrA